MSQTSTDVLYVNMEQVRKDLPALYELNSTAYGMLTKGAEKYKISKTPSGFDFRIPLQMQPPGKFGTFSLAGGSLGLGSGFSTQQMYQTYFPLKLGIQMNLDAVYTTESANLSVVNAFRQNMKQAIPSMQRYADASFHNISSGNQGIFAISTNYNTGVVTCDPEFGADLVQIGMDVEIYSSNLATQRTSAVSPDNLPYVSAVNKANNTFTLANLGAITPQNTDYYVFPQGGAAAPPVWLNGLYYFHNTATSGNLLGLDRATYSEIQPNYVNANGYLVPDHGLQLKAKIRQRRGKIPANFKGLIHDAQAAQILTVGISISEWHRGPSDAMIDVMPKYGKNDDRITWCGVEHLIDVHQSKQRVDWQVLDNWGRVYLKELDFYKVPGDGRMIFEGRTSAGTPAASIMYYLFLIENFYCVDPGSDAFVYGATIKPGY